VLLARRADGRWADAADIAAIARQLPPALRRRSARRAACAWRQGLPAGALDADRDLPKRFAVPFLVARMPEGQSRWPTRPSSSSPCGCARPTPWRATRPAVLHDLPDHPHAAAPGAVCRRGRRAGRRRRRAAAVDSCPRAGLLAGKEARYMEHEAPYGELALVCPDGQACTAGLAERAPGAAAEEPAAPDRPQPRRDDRPRHQQLPGGRPGTGYIAIDPGPADAAPGAAVARGGRRHPHDRLHPFAPRPLPGAAPLQAMCAAGAPPPILGLPSAPTARAASSSRPTVRYK
jgi:recombination protein RecT